MLSIDSLPDPDVRENILSLRTTLTQEKGLESAAEEYLTEFGIQMGVATSFSYQVIQTWIYSQSPRFNLFASCKKR
ncbi:MAG: hypothetical protein Fur0017_27480 [Anaerolineales bacterium]